MRTHGVDVRLNTKAQAFTGKGKADGVRLEPGEELRTDLVIAATGVKSNLDLLHGSEIISNRGIAADEQL